MIKPGVYPHLSNNDYHADGAISRSGILHFMNSPYKYWAEYLNANKPEKEQTDAMIFGSAFHSYMLEPDKFEHEYIKEPDYMELPKRVLLKNVGRELFESYKTDKAKIEYANSYLEEVFIENSVNKTILKSEDMDLLKRMRNAILDHPQARNLIEGCTYEQSYFWHDPHTGIMCKARPDIVGLSQNYVVDLKTIVSASPSYFQRAMSDGGYHIQAAMIRDAIRECGGADIKTFINICVEKTYPYQIGIYIIDEEALEIGKQEYKQALLDIKVCLETNEWPSYEIQTVNLPKWRK